MIGEMRITYNRAADSFVAETVLSPHQQAGILESCLEDDVRHSYFHPTNPNDHYIIIRGDTKGSASLIRSDIEDDAVRSGLLAKYLEQVLEQLPQKPTRR